MHDYPHPFNEVVWNTVDQAYWFKMCRSYRYPVSLVREPFRCLIEANKDDVWEAEYEQYLQEYGY